MRTAPAVDVDQAAAEWIGRVQHMCPGQVLAACPFAPPRAEVNGRAANETSYSRKGIEVRPEVQAWDRAGCS
jgi:hypothetical protein